MKQLLYKRTYSFLATLYEKLRNGFALFLCGASLGWLIGVSTSAVLQTVLAALLAVIATLLTATLGLSKSSDNKIVSLADALAGLFIKTFGQPVSDLSPPSSADKSETEPLITKPIQPYNALPLSWFLFCLAVGAAGGIFTRTNELLGTIPSVVTWRLGVSRADSTLIAKQLLAEQYGLGVTGTPKSTTNAEAIPVASRFSEPALAKAVLVASRFSAAALFSDTRDSVDFCESVKYTEGLELKDELEEQIIRQLNRSPTEPERRGLEQMQRLLARQPDERVLQQIKDQLCTTR